MEMEEMEFTRTLLNQDILKQMNRNNYQKFTERVKEELFKYFESKNLVTSLDDVYVGRGYGEITFKIDKCPYWIFGLQLHERTRKYKPEDDIVIESTFWGQHTLFADKIRASRANYTEDFDLIVRTSKTSWEENFEEFEIFPLEFYVQPIIDFIIKEPEVSFCRDYFGWDLNTSIHTKKECVRKYNQLMDEYRRKEEFDKEFNIKFIHFLKEKIIPLSGLDLEIVDEGKNTYPRYSFILKVDKENEPEDFKDGYCYNCFDVTGEESRVMRKFKSLFYNFNKECKEIYNNKYEFKSKLKRKFYGSYDSVGNWYDYNCVQYFSEESYKEIFQGKRRVIQEVDGIKVYRSKFMVDTYPDNF